VHVENILEQYSCCLDTNIYLISRLNNAEAAKWLVMVGRPRLDSRQAREFFFFFRHHLQSVSGAHPAYNKMGTVTLRLVFAGEYSWLLNFILSEDLEYFVGAYMRL